MVLITDSKLTSEVDMTTKGMAKLKGWIEVGTNTFMPLKTFEKYSLDSELTAEEKQKLYNSGDSHTQLYETLKRSKKKLNLSPLNSPKEGIQEHSEASQAKWSDEEIKAVNPVFIDERLEKIKHLHPQQLDERKNEWI